jgi:hypothetical protein
MKEMSEYNIHELGTGVLVSLSIILLATCDPIAMHLDFSSMLAYMP